MRLITLGRIELEQTQLRLQRIVYPKRVGELRRLRQQMASQDAGGRAVAAEDSTADGTRSRADAARSEAHTSELQSLMRHSYALFCLKKTHLSPPPTNEQ